MSLSFQEDEYPDDFWAPLFLAYRDITGQAPIDKVAYPGVHVTPACFPNNTYDGHVFEGCFSNLLSAQFRRFAIDLYWDVSNQAFTLCPAQLPHLADNTTTSVDPGPTTAVSGVVVPSASKADSTISSNTVSGLVERQENRTVAIESPSNSTTQESATTTLSSSITTITGNSGSQLLQLGPYRCSDDVGLDSLIKILKGWIKSTSDPVRARLIILQFNMHAAANPVDPEGTPDTPTASELPSSSELLGSQFQDEGLGHYFYKPSELAADRANLNASWFSVSAKDRLPVTDYYEITVQDDGILTTSNGWPSEAFLLFNHYKRFLLTYDQIAPEMSRYNFLSDDYFFPPNLTKSNHEPDVNAQGVVTSGCYYNSSDTSVTGVNNSWAVTDVDEYSGPPQMYLGNLTSCGLAPTLNFTLNGTADTDYSIYQNFTQGTLFGWAPGEPRNKSSSSDIDGPANQFRCVVLDSSNAFRGHWRSANCQQKHRVACRVGDDPFNWKLSASKELYMNTPQACPSGSAPGIPRTSLENIYLYQHILQGSDRQGGDSFQDGVWINLNSLDVQGCWVTTGPNGPCTYRSEEKDRHDREVLIPTVAALIVLVLTVVTILVKCNVNRRNSRVRRVGPGGWEYEGVPS